MPCESSNQRVCQAENTVKTGWKWSANRAVAEAEARLHHADIVGVINQGRLGLGSINRARWKDASTTGRKSLVQEELCTVEEEGRQARAASMEQQGSWTRWSGV